MDVNPIPVRIDPFRIELGPTNDNAQSTLSLGDADTILNVVEDLVSQYTRNHFDGVGDDDGDNSVVFKYAILAYVELPSNYSPSATTVLEFSGGIGYFGGFSSVVPSHEEMQLLVDLALNDDTLQRAIASYFPFVTRAEYHRGISGYSDVTVDSSGSNDPGPTGNDGTAASALLNNVDILDLSGDGSGGNGDSTDQMIIIAASACGAAIVFCLLLGLLAYHLHHHRRKSYWREDNQSTTSSNNSKSKLNHPAGAAVAIQEDAALEGMEGGRRMSSPRGRGSSKQQSLHLRDSLQQTHDLEKLPMAIIEGDEQSEAGSSRLGRLLSTAAAAILLPSNDGDYDYGNSAAGLEKPGVVNRKQSNSTSSSSCSPSDDEGAAAPQQQQQRILLDNRHHQLVDPDAADDVTCPSDFEGNAVIRPNMVPVPSNLDHANLGHIMHGALPPPSRTASARRDELPIASNSSNLHNVYPNTPFATPTKAAANTNNGKASSSTQGGFMAKYIHPIAGNVSLPYFGSAGADDSPNSKHKGGISPNTQATTPEDDIDIDIDSRWSDISSELDLGNKTDDDFDMDQAWDPDDASVNSSEYGKDAFSPMAAAPSPSSKRNDNVRLLQTTDGLKYNLHKVKSLHPPVITSSRDSSPQRTVHTRDTTII